MSQKPAQREPAVCLLISSFHPRVGGGETHARILARELQRLDVAALVVTRRHEAGLERVTTVDGVAVHRVSPSGHPRLGKYLMLLPALWALIRLRRRFDIIYVCGLRVLGLAGVMAGLLLRKPCVLRAEACGELSGAFIYDSPHGATRWRGNSLIRLALRMRNALFRRADRFLAISRVIRDEFLAAGVSEDRIALITNGIEADAFSPATTDEREALRRALNLPDAFLFAYAGKLNRGKGLEMLLRVWERVVREQPRAHLVLIGAGGTQFLSCEAELRAFVSDRGLSSAVTFTGYTTRVADHLRACDAFVFPSESEALGLALLEAMACGLPSIASATGGILDIVTDHQNGRLVPAGDEQAWLTAITDLMTRPDLARRWAEEGPRTVRERFSIRQVAMQHRDLFRSLRTR